ncbi:MAG TPA: tRNA preQ1(34) S-adenosylmethionine ribosyltransferase-isomerase QueA [Synergistaceae bacterium]|nr:tRNA preQ1(34) S-adenosylmethionine ribosyltransferase-isomerase QueA [Synergistaceae bacterium]HPJ24616.1 tRNA preQ1(34) S-adenosylmethionine ribosyltransferase-isomerase QueA [Synergistaceae bacterium]HPQ36189.1 tRNA preQ1(34) S-adenosylmethionine ribosyltransferase-isomerase QueA [Synergistaceae bacterium]
MEKDLFQAKKYFYELPKEQIAQNPVEPRDMAKLLVLERETGKLHHRIFREVGDFLRSGDLLVLNDTKVLAARLFGEKAESGGKVEIFLLRPSERGPHVWEALVRPGKKLKRHTRVFLDKGIAVHVLPSSLEGGLRFVEFPESLDVYAFLEDCGIVPLPPYITESRAEADQYQTIYARELGSVAAPTAGLHFTEQLLKDLQKKGISLAFLTLHIGLGTFRPVQVEDIRDHTMHEEHFEISSSTVRAVEETKKRKGKVIAVGTTAVRGLETGASSGVLRAGKDVSTLFIYPGYSFRVVDGIITNFHLPQSTLLMLVSAFGGYEKVSYAYREAVEKGYRFYSFGDAMMIL